MEINLFQHLKDMKNANGAIRDYDIKTLKVMAQMFSYQYLNAFWHNLKSGKVYDDLAREINDDYLCD